MRYESKMEFHVDRRGEIRRECKPGISRETWGSEALTKNVEWDLQPTQPNRYINDNKVVTSGGLERRRNDQTPVGNADRRHILWGEPWAH